MKQKIVQCFSFVERSILLYQWGKEINKDFFFFIIEVKLENITNTLLRSRKKKNAAKKHVPRSGTGGLVTEHET